MTTNKFVLNINGQENPQTLTKEEIFALQGQVAYTFHTHGITVNDGTVFNQFMVDECDDYVSYSYHAQVSGSDGRSDLVGAEGSMRLIGKVICTVSFTRYSNEAVIYVDFSEEEEFRQVSDLRLVV